MLTSVVSFLKKNIYCIFPQKVMIYVDFEVSQGSYGRLCYWNLFEEL